jgi:hypothetical protein
MVAYADAYWEGSIDDRISTSRATFYLGDCLVSWLSKKWYSISLSTTISVIYFSNNILYSGSLDEANPTIYTSAV